MKVALNSWNKRKPGRLPHLVPFLPFTTVFLETVSLPVERVPWVLELSPTEDNQLPEALQLQPDCLELVCHTFSTDAKSL